MRALISPRLVVIGLFLAGAAHGQVLVESFKGSTTADSNWVFAGSGYVPVLTGDGVIDTVDDGWLRLTSSGGNQATSAYNNTAFDSAGATIYASFEYASWGGTGADGITFFLFDGSETFSVGANGGSLGYAQKTGVDGLAGGYIGVALDEYGNFSRESEGRVGGIGFTPDSISVRGNEASEYEYLGGSSTLATSIDTPSVGSRPTTVNTVEILLSATNQLTVTLQQGSVAAQTVLQLDLSAYDRPETLKLGFTGGTGGATNYHEVRNIEASTVTAQMWDNDNDNGDSTWGDSSNWDPDAVPVAYADILFGNIPIDENTNVTTDQTVVTESDRTIRSISLDAAFDYTIDDNTLIFDDNGAPGFSGIQTSQVNGSGDHTINSDLEATNDIYIRNNSTGTLELTGDLDTGGNTITFDGTGNSTSDTGAITGSGSVVKNDSGTVTLGGANTYTGSTTINNGTIRLDGSGQLSDVTAVTVDTLGTFDMNDISDTVGSIAGAGDITLGSGTLTAGGDDTSTTFSGTISETGDLVKTGSGTLTLSTDNTYTGDTTVSEGTLVIGGQTDSPNMDIASGATLDFNVASGSRDNAADTTFTGTGTLQKTGSGTLQWNSNTATFELGSGALIDVQGGTLTGGASANEDWTNNLADLNVGSGATFDGVEANVRVDALTGTGTIESGFTGSGYSALTFGVDDGSGEFSGVLADSVATGNFVKAGSGNQTLSGNNTFTGTTIVSEGTLTLASGNALGTTAGNTTVSSGAILSLTNDIAVGAEAIASSGTVTNTSGTNSYAGVLSGTGNLTVDGGSLTLSGDNTYTGDTDVNAGTLVITNQIDSPNIDIASGAAVDFNVTSGTLDNAADTTFTGTGTLQKTGSGTMRWGPDTATFELGSGALIDVQGGTLVGGSYGDEDWTNNLSDLNVASGATFNGVEANVRVDALTGTGTIESGYNGAGYSEFTFGVDDGGGEFSGVLANSTSTGNFTKEGTGNQTLSGANTFTGTTTVSEGTLTLANANALGTTAGGTTVASGANLALSNNIAVGAEAIANSGTVSNASGSNSLSGVISGSGGVSVDAGQLTLSGTNTYTGDTAIGGGTLILGASDTIGNGSDVSIAATGVLDLNSNSAAIGDLSASGGATLDFGTPGTQSTFVFDTYTPPASGIMVVNNWSDSDGANGDQLATTVASQTVSSIYFSGIGVASQQTTTTNLDGGYGNAYLLAPVTQVRKEWKGNNGGGSAKSWKRNGNWITPVEPNSSQVALFDDDGLLELVVNMNGNYTIAGIEFGVNATSGYTLNNNTNQVDKVLTLDGDVPFIQQKSAVDQTIDLANFVFGNNTIADITGAGDLIISAPITESGGSNSFVRDGTGAGKLILSGDNAFSGGMFATTGVVRAESATALGTGDANVGDSGTIEIGTGLTITNDFSIAGTGDGGNGAIRSTDGANTLSGVISGTGTVQVDADTLTLTGTNTYTGETKVAGGTLIATNDSSLGTGAGGTTVETGAKLSLTNGITIANEDLVLNGTGQLENTSGTNAFGGVISGAGAVNVTTGNLTLSNTNTYSGNTTVASDTTLTLSADNALGAGSTTVNDDGTLALTGGITVDQTSYSLTGSGNGDAGAIQNVSGSNRLTGDITLAGDTTFQSDAGTLNIGTDVDGSVYNASGDQITLGSNDLTFDGAGNSVLKADLTGTGNLIKDGNGQFIMANGTNTWTGTTEIKDGEMVLATYFNDAPGTGPLVDFGIRGPVVIGDGTEAAGTAKLTLGTNDAGAGTSFSNMFAGDIDVTINSDGRLDTRGHTTYVRDIDIDGGSINAQTGAFGGNNLFVTGDITSTSTTQVATIDGKIDFNGDADQSINVVTGSTLDINARIQNGGIDKTGDGTLVVSGGNTFTDDVDVLDGTVRVDNKLGLGSTTGGTNVTSGAQLQLDGVAIGTEALTINGTGESSAGALQTVASSGANSWAGNVTVGSTSEIQVNTGTTLGISGNITGSGKTLTIESIGDTTLSGTNTLNTLNKTGAGTLTVTTSPNTISTVNVNDGTFSVGTNNILSDSLDLNVGASGTFFMDDGINETIDQFNSSGTIDVDGVFTMNGGIISGGSGAGSDGEIILTAGNTLEIATDFTFGAVGTMGGGDQLGTLTLGTGYFGTVAANKAKLVISGESTVNIGTLNIDGNSIIDFTAAETNTLNLGSLTFTAGSTLLIEGWSRFNDLWTSQNFPGATLDIRDADTAKITFSGFGSDETIWRTFDFGAKEITVPEPSSYGAILMGIGLSLWLTRRKHRSTGTD